MAKKIACLGDDLRVGTLVVGYIYSSGQDGTFLVDGAEVAVDGSKAFIYGTPPYLFDILPKTLKTFHNGKKIVNEDSCLVINPGVLVKPPDDRKVNVE
jgi:hypothetical protein